MIETRSFSVDSRGHTDVIDITAKVAACVRGDGMLGPSLTMPFKDGALMLGRWQQIVLIDFVTRARKREITVQVIAE